jgi:hypothetical protein
VGIGALKPINQPGSHIAGRLVFAVISPAAEMIRARDVRMLLNSGKQQRLLLLRGFQKISITKWSSVGAVNGVDLECLAQIKIELGIRLDVPGPRVELHA